MRRREVVKNLIIKKMLTSKTNCAIIKVQKEKGIAKMDKNEMMDDVARKFGMEHEYTIGFCSMVESGWYSEGMILWYYVMLMETDAFCEE